MRIDELRPLAVCLQACTWGGQRWERADVLYADSRGEPTGDAWAVLGDHGLRGRLVCIGDQDDGLLFELQGTVRRFQLGPCRDHLEFKEVASDDSPKMELGGGTVGTSSGRHCLRWAPVGSRQPAPRRQQPAQDPLRRDDGVDWLRRGL